MFGSLTSWSRIIAMGALTLTMLLTSCGTPDDIPSASIAASFPIEVRTGNSDSTDTVTIPTPPSAIVSLNSSATESLFAIGAEHQIVAVDSKSNFLSQAPITNLSAENPDIAAILSYSPDLVVTAKQDDDMISALAEAGVPTVVLPPARSLNEVYEQIHRLGTITGYKTHAYALVRAMRMKIIKTARLVPKAVGTRYFHEVDPDLHSTSPSSLNSEIYAQLGLVTIVPDTDSPAPKLTTDQIVHANPDVIFLADAQCCGVTGTQLAHRSGWDQISAVQKNQIFTVSADLSDTWGPRVADYVELIGGYLSKLDESKK